MIVRYLRVLVLLMLCGVSSDLLSQKYLHGVVTEEDQKGNVSPLFGVNVFWKGTTIGTTTDTNGVFKIMDDHTNHWLIISYVGYENDTIEIVNHEDLMVVLKNSLVIDQVEVIYRKKSTSLAYMDPIHTEKLNEKELFKAACCNLSESFETNASIDANYADAVTGTRQIQMLGLDGIYTQILTEYLPTNAGLATKYGLTYIPGAWMKEISISKGAGSVVSGHSSITGQINTELRKPNELKEKFYLNLYGNAMGRLEGNADYKVKLNEKWSTSFLLHGRTLQFKNDVNNDGFLDQPLNETFIGMNRWKYQGTKGLMAQFNVKYVNVLNQGGQVNHDFENPDVSETWGMEFKTERVEGTAKIGYVFANHRYRSIGLQLMGINHVHQSYFGRRFYDGLERNFYTNLIYQDIIGNTNHKYKVGLSYYYDAFEESFALSEYDRIESVPGAHAEYTYNGIDDLTAVAGMRIDFHNLYGTFYSPRLHFRYALTEKTIVRISGGMGTRVTNVLAENSAYMASNRAFIIPGNEDAFGLKPEQAINAGISLSQDFRLNYREGSIVVDLFRTEFRQQVVVDVDESPQEVNFYNLNYGKSFANSFQIELNYELIRRLDLKMAYRHYDVRTEFLSGIREKALLPRHKALANVAFETKKTKKLGFWRFDVTLQHIGQQRLPDTRSNPEARQLEDYSPSYQLLSAQITKVFSKRFEVYLGGENLTNFRQEDPVLAADDPYGDYFDASIVWAPIFGRNIYGGLRFWIR